MIFLWFNAAFLFELIAAGGFVVYLISQKEWVFRCSYWILVTGFCAHTIFLGFQYSVLGPTPGVNLKSLFSFFSWSILCAYLLLQIKFRLMVLGSFAAPFAVFLMIVSSTMPWIEGSVEPVFKTVWLVIHVGTTFMGDGMFAIACAAGIMYLLQEHSIKTKKLGAFYSRLPSLATLDTLNHYSLIYGFTFLTVGMVTGSVYAQYVLGAYWQWDPKEVWSLITWLFYAALLHQRLTVGWRGRKAALMAIGCFCLIIFTFLGASLWLGGVPQLRRSRSTNDGMTTIINIGMNHRTAPVELRECLATGPEDHARALAFMRDRSCIREAFFLSTCNRVETLVISPSPSDAEEAVIELLSELGNLPKDRFRSNLYVLEGTEAVRHVFRVASSLDSMVVGEPQILGQIKSAYLHTTEQRTSGVILNRLMHRAFHVAKRVRTETGISESAVSISYAAVELARKIFHELKGKKVLLIGAGEMAELAATHLMNQGVGSMCVANRTIERAIEVAARFQAEPISLGEVEDRLGDVDIVISSTASTGHVITREQVKNSLRKRRNRPLFLIDIAVPRDIQPEANDLDNVYVYDIDDLGGVVRLNLAQRRQEAVKAERIVEEEVVKFRQWLDTLDVVPTIVELRTKAASIVEAELRKSRSALGELSPAQEKALRVLTGSIAAKVLNDPILFLKGTIDRTGLTMYLDVTRRLFNLDGDRSKSPGDAPDDDIDTGHG